MKKILLFSILSFASLVSCKDRSVSSEEGSLSNELNLAALEKSAQAPATSAVRFSPPEESDKRSDAGNGVGLTESTVVSAPVKMAEKIKKTADIDISVEDYKSARIAIDKIVKAGNAYIGGENEQNSTYSISNSMTIRVSNKEFDGMVSNLAAIASHVNSKNVYMEDVTAQFIDITARLKTKKEVEKRYLDLLQKAVKVSDILEVEQQLSVIREEIEAKEGELKYLNDQVDYSTINLTFHQNFEYTPQDEPGFFGRMGHALGNGWKGFLSFLIGVVYVWPLWIILGAITFFLVRFIKRRIKK